MNSISTLTSVSSFTSQPQAAEIKASVITEKAQEQTGEKSVEKKHLPTDKVDISEAAQKKLSESETSSEKTGTAKDVMAEEEVATETQNTASDPEKEIRQLSLEILEITVKIEMLKTKEDQESIKEKQALEVSLAMKKGKLEALIEQKLQMAAQA